MWYNCHAHTKQATFPCYSYNILTKILILYPAAATEAGEVLALDIIDVSINGPGVVDPSFFSTGVFAANTLGLALARYGLTAAFASSSIIGN